MRRVALPFLLIFSIATAWAWNGRLTVAELLPTVQFRGIGPAVTGGRIVDIEVHPSDLNTIYAASASGGLWKTENTAPTRQPVFDNYKTISIGDVAIAPSDPKILWVGTGEHNNQRSSHYGDGVYKSTDGGETWQNMGLKDSVHIGRIAIDHKDPNVVFVASQGPLYRGGGERGVYKTTDGGKSWQLVLKGANDTTGFIDIQMDPMNNKVVYAAAMDRLRRAWNIRDYGPGSGLWKTTDAGKTWTQLKGGFPEGELGRIGIAVYPKNPKIIYTVVINQAPRTGTEIYKSEDAGSNWKKVNEDRVNSSSYYGQIRVDPTNPNRVFNLSVNAQWSVDGGKRWRNFATRGVHVDHHALWIDPVNPKRWLLGNDGGFYVTYDDGETWEFVNNLPIPQFYAIGADMSVPYNVMGGLQDNGAWHGPSRTRIPSGVHNMHWINISGGDGFYSIPDPEEPTIIYTGSQFGNIQRFDLQRRTSRRIRPRSETRLRSNWMSPFVLSPHNSKTLYWGSQFLHKTTDRGDNWTTISPDLTTNNAEKIRGNVPHCTITTIDESPVKQGVIWVGTDDGNVWVTQDEGKNWSQVNGNIPNAPKEWWVSRVHASPHQAGTAFVSYTGFREDDFTPMLWKTTDFGKTWTSLAANLPQEQIAVVKQDMINPDLLVVGTETGCHLSLDGGRSWNKLSHGLPTVAVQDLIIHPRDGDLILGTHGRGIYIANIAPFRHAHKAGDKTLFVFEPAPALSFSTIGNMFDPFNGDKRYLGSNPSGGAPIMYYLSAAPSGDVKIEIVDGEGKVVREMDGTKNVGVNTVNWNVRLSNGVAPAGKYQVRVKVGDAVETVPIEVFDWER